MAQNILQIKRSLGAGAAATPASLLPGELAYTSNGSVLYVGNSSAVVAIGGARVPGVATANQAVVLDSNGYVDVLRVIDTVSVGNSTVNLVINSTFVTVDAVGVSNVIVGANVYLSTDTLFVGNNTANLHGNSTLFQMSNSSGSANLQPTQLVIGSSTLDSSTLRVGANVVANAVAMFVGDAAANYVANSIAVRVSNSTVNSTLSSSRVSLGANAFLSTDALSLGNSSANVVANSTLVQVANSSGVVNIAPTSVSLGAVVIDQANVSATNINASANVTTVVLNARDAVLSGNLTVHGTLTTIDTQNLSVSDPLIFVASNNATTDTLDIGWFGEFGNSTVTQYAGMFRDHADGGVLKTFSGAIPTPTTTVDTANVNFDLATLQTWVKSGGLVSNSTGVTITANSTLAVTLVANSMTLSTPLAGTSGGTGQSSVTNQDLLVANSSNGFDKLSLGAAWTVLQSNGSSLIYAGLDGGSF